MGTFKEISRWYNAAYVSPTSQELALHQELISRWTSFAKTGNPNNVNYGGWLPVPIQGPNRDGSATEIDQQYFSLEHGGVMWSGTSMNEVIEYCSAFPRWNPFALVTDFPTFSPTEYLPDRTRRPSRRPTRVPTRRPFQRIRRDTPSPTDFPTEFPTLSPTEYSTSHRRQRELAGPRGGRLTVPRGGRLTVPRGGRLTVPRGQMRLENQHSSLRQAQLIVQR